MAWGRLGAQVVAQRAAENAEARRAEAALDFEAFCRRQQARFAKTLQTRINRIHRAKFGDCEGDGAHYLLTRRGVTEASAPVHRKFQEQREPAQ